MAAVTYWLLQETNEPWNDRKILQTRCDRSWVMLQ